MSFQGPSAYMARNELVYRARGGPIPTPSVSDLPSGTYIVDGSGKYIVDGSGTFIVDGT